MFRIFANHVRPAVPADDFTFITHWFYRCSYFHTLTDAVRDPPFTRIVRRNLNFYFIPRHNADKIKPHLTRKMTKHNVAVRQFYAKERIGKALGYHSFDFNIALMGHM